MFRIHSTASRTALVRSPNFSRWVRYKTRIHGVPRKSFQQIKEVPETTEELVASLQQAYSAPGSNRRSQGDNKRVNIVGKELCDDILDRMKPSLLKHSGCDIIDVNPGAGVWSSAVHNLLKPRNHYLMEPDHELYGPLLQPLLDEEGSTYNLIPKSGVVWANLNSILSPEYFPQQPQYKEGDPRLDKPNDTLLFMANLGWYPKKPFRGFNSISMLVVNQLLSAARAHSLFQQYGLIRMLIWISDDEGQSIIPKTMALRRKMAIESELTCSNISEIASSTLERSRYRREDYYNIRSSRAVFKRMEVAGITTPVGRAGLPQLQAAKNPEGQESEDDGVTRYDYHAELEDLETRMAAGNITKFVDGKTRRNVKEVTTPEYVRLKALRRYNLDRKKQGKIMGPDSAAELEALEAKLASGEIEKFNDPTGTKSPEITPDMLKLRYLRSRVGAAEKRTRIYAPIYVEFDAIARLEKELPTLHGSEAEEAKREIEERTAAFQDGVESLSLLDGHTLRLQLDERKTSKNQPAMLMWDRREAEPLKVHAEEFYPNHELSLLDFHPQPLWPVLRDDFPASYDIFEYILSILFVSSTQSVRKGLAALAPGAYEWLVEECPSITDTSKNGHLNLEMMSVRCLTLEMFREIIEAWMRWPFRPDRFELMRRVGSEPYDPDDEAAEDKD